MVNQVVRYRGSRDLGADVGKTGLQEAVIHNKLFWVVSGSGCVRRGSPEAMVWGPPSGGRGEESARGCVSR